MNTVPFNTEKQNPAEFITFEELAKLMKVRYQQVYARAESNRLGVVYELFGKKLIARSEIARWQENREAYFAKQRAK